MKTLRVNDKEVAIIAEDGSLNGSARLSGSHIIFNQASDAQRVWELLTADALEYKEPSTAMHSAELEMLSKRIDDLEMVAAPEPGDETLSELYDHLEKRIDELEDEDHQHDVVMDFIKQDQTGTIRRKVLEIVADKLRF